MILYHRILTGKRREESGAALPMRPPRVPMVVPVTFLGDRSSGEGMTGDLSWSGCAVTAEASVSVGACLRLQLQLERGPIALVPVDLAVVRWSANGRFGVEFIKIDQVDQARLRSLVTSASWPKRVAQAEGVEDAAVCPERTPVPRAPDHSYFDRHHMIATELS